jgi:hypothetical protein
MDIKYNNYRSLEKFVLVFKKKIKKLINLDIEPPKNWHITIFIARIL